MISGFKELRSLLTRINQEGDFPISLLIDAQGFLIASSATNDQNPEQQSAAVALMQKTIEQARQTMGFVQTDEITLYISDGLCLVCRPFLANGRELILAVTLADKKQSYRRITNQAIVEITDMLKEGFGK